MLRFLLLSAVSNTSTQFAADKDALAGNKYQLNNKLCSPVPPRGSTTRHWWVVCWSLTITVHPKRQLKWAFKCTKQLKLLYKLLKYIFSPITSLRVRLQWQPLWNPIKMTPPPTPLPEDRVDSGRPRRVSCRLPWRCDKLIFHLNARCSEHWCKGYYPECPSGLANSAKAAHWSTSKKWKMCKKTKYIYNI